MSIPRTLGVRAAELAHRPSTRPTLADWMERYVAGDTRAFDVLFRAIAPRVRRQIKARIGNDLHTDDLLQHTMLRAHAARARYRRPDVDADEALVSWYCAIARNVAANHLRGVCRDRLQLGDDAETAVAEACDGDDVEQLGLARELAAARIAQLHAALASLPPKQRVVVHMHKLQGLPMAEVSRRLGVRDGAVRVRAHRAYETLRSVIGSMAA